MGFLDDLLTGFQSQMPQLNGNEPMTSPPFFGLRPGFDFWDIPDILGRVINRQDPLPGPGLPGPGGESMTRRDLPEVGADGGMSMERRPGNGQLRTTGARTAMYIGGNCPGMWHDTAVREKYDKNTGAFLGTVGGNRVVNRVSLVQDDSGALEFFSPVKPTWSLKYKPRRRHHHHRARRVRHHHHPRRRKRVGHHHHGLTAKQLKAGFGGKSRMR